MLNLNSLQIPEHVVFEQLDGEFVILNSEDSTYYRLNRVASRFWSLMVGDADRSHVIPTLLAEFDVDEEALTTDLLAVVGELTTRGLLVPRDQSSAP